MSTDDTAPAAELAGHQSTAEHEAAALRAREAASNMAREQTARLEEAVAAARLEERARIRAIVNAEAAKGREKQALVLATETALTVAEAEKILGASPKETRLEALAQRASAGPCEFGAPGGTEEPDAGALIQEGWKRAIANANRQFAPGLKGTPDMTVLVETRHPGEFILSEANGQRSREAITIASGAGIIAAGTVLGKVTATGKYLASAVGATDGSQTPAAIAIYGADASTADAQVSAIVRDAEVNGNCLTYHADRDQPAERNAANTALATLGVIVR